MQKKLIQVSGLRAEVKFFSEDPTHTFCRLVIENKEGKSS